jgi:hypothetical protein
MSRGGLLAFVLLCAQGCGSESVESIAHVSFAAPASSAPAPRAAKEPAKETTVPSDTPAGPALRESGATRSRVLGPALPGPKSPSSAALLVTASVSGDGESVVKLRFEVANVGDQAVYLFTPLVRYDFEQQRWGPAPDRLYSTLDDDDVLRFSKRLVEVPTETSVFQREIPYLTRLAPGEQHVEDHLLDTPLALNSAYSRGSVDEPGIFLLSRGVAMDIGYVPEGTASLVASRVQPGLFEIDYASGLEAQRLLSAEFPHLARVYHQQR